MDASASRMSKDDQNILKLNEFFELHNPFPETHLLMSITSGLKGDENMIAIMFMKKEFQQ